MPTPVFVRSSVAGLTFVSLIGTAHASEAQLVNGDTPRIVGGDETAECSWPTTVAFSGCTGTLIHPKVVITAAHCGSSHTSIKLGETRDGEDGYSVDVEFCEIYPGGSIAQNDYALCVLKDEVLGVPIVPPLMGDDTSLLVEGAKVWAVGFGEDDSAFDGRKRQVELAVTDFENGFVYAGGDGQDGCIGDSGGPLYLELPGGRGWRAFGITSHGPYPCGDGGGWAQMHLVMDWFEDVSGLDLTPCHDSDGTYNPGPNCGEKIPLAPATASGSWASTCEFGEIADYEIPEPESMPSEPVETVDTVSTTGGGDTVSTTVSVLTTAETESTSGLEPDESWLTDDTFPDELVYTVATWTTFDTWSETTPQAHEEACDVGVWAAPSRIPSKGCAGCSATVNTPLSLGALGLFLFSFLGRFRRQRGGALVS